MSWQAYVDNQICAQVSCRFAFIAGLSNGEIWAKYEQDSTNSVTVAELKKIADTMSSNPNEFQKTGIHLAGEKYFCLQADNHLIRGRKGSSAMVAMATNISLIVVVTTDGFPPGQLNTVVEKLGDYLRNHNY